MGHEKFRLNIQRKCFQGLEKAAQEVKSPSLEGFMVHIDVSLSDMV